MEEIRLTSEFSLEKIQTTELALNLYVMVQAEKAPNYLKKKLSEEEYIHFLVESYSYVLVYKNSQAGIVSLYQEESTGMWLTSLIIFAEFRGQGLAALAKHGIYHIGYDQLKLEQILTRFRVQDTNQASRNYNIKHCGCIITTIEPDWYDNGDVRITVANHENTWLRALQSYVKHEIVLTNKKVLDTTA